MIATAAATTRSPVAAGPLLVLNRIDHVTFEARRAANLGPAGTWFDL